MARRLARWWWIPAGIVVATMIAARIDSTVIRVAFGVYVVLNLVGTAMLLREVRDQAPLPGRHPERWPFLVELTFVLQLPVGIVVVLSGGS